jgi:hypothetical protein
MHAVIVDDATHASVVGSHVVFARRGVLYAPAEQGRRIGSGARWQQLHRQVIVHRSRDKADNGADSVQLALDCPHRLPRVTLAPPTGSS